MCIAFNPPREVVWKWIEAGYIIIHDLREVTPTMRFWLAHWFSFSWLVVHVMSLVSVLLLQRCWGRKRLVFVKDEKSGAMR